MAGPTSATRTSSSPWAAIPLKTTRSGSASSWKPGGTATRSWCRVDPRFNRTAAVADRFVQIRAGTDIAFLGGLINHVLTHNRYHDEYVRLFTNAPFLVSEQYAFDEKRGVFAGWDDEKKTYTDKSSWNYELDEQGFAKVDPTLAHPRSVFQVMKRFYSRYTPDTVSNICGCSADDFVKAADLITSTHTPDRVGTILYALGWTHHSHSVQLIHAAAMLQLLLGNIGRPGGGLNALRGHANIQGGTDCGMAYHNLPGYIAIPKADQESLASFIGAVTPKPLRPNSMNFWANTDRFVVSQLKAYYGTTATADNEFGYAMHPRLPQSAPGAYENWSWAYIFDHMYRGDMEGFFSFGMNPVSNGPHSRKAIAALAKLKWMVVAENFEQETASFWRPDILELVDLKPEDVQTEVFLLPAANFAEKDGSFVNSARWIQWKWKAVDPPGEARADQEIVARIFLKVRELYQQEGGTYPDPVRNLNWWYSNPAQPSLDEVCKEINGWALQDIRDPAGAVTMRAGQQLARFLDARADGSTLSGNWLYIGMLHRCRQPDAASIAERSERARPVSGMDRQLAGEPPHPLQPLLGRCAGTPVGSVARRHRVERPALDRRHARLHGRIARRTRDSARSSCFPKEWRDCSCRGSSSTDRGRSTTSRSNRRSPTRCIPSTARTRPCAPSPPSTTCSASPTSFRSSARPTG